MHSKLRGSLCVFASAACFGTEAILVKFAYAQGLMPATITFYRFAIAALVLAPFLVSGLRTTRLARRDTIALALIGAGLIVPVTGLLVLALRRIPASLAIICLFIYPTVAALLAVPILGERLTPLKAVALLGTFAGVAIVAGGPGSSPDAVGTLLALGAGVLNAAAVVGVKRYLANVAPMTVTAGTVGFAAVTYAIVALAAGAPLAVNTGSFWILTALAVFSTAMPFGLFYSGLPHIEASLAAVISASEPIFTVILAVLVLSERLTPVQAAGGLLILASGLLLTRGGVRSRPTPDGEPEHGV